MDMRAFGNTGLRVSALGLGCNNFGGRLDLARTRRVVDAAIDAGITFIDTADVYGDRGGSETLLGQVLGERRRELILATKFGLPMDDAGRLKGAAPAYVKSAIEASLKRLRTDWIDVYYLHRPDPATPIEETLAALDELVQEGKVRFIGCSNMSGVQLSSAIGISRARGLTEFVVAQDEYSLLSRGIEPELVPAIETHGLALVPYFPLASGLLSGKYHAGKAPPAGSRLADARYSGRFINERNTQIVDRLTRFCTERGRTLLELAFCWLLAHGSVASVIAGATSPEQVQQNAASLGWRMTPEEIAAVDALVTG